jgi:hypothetical protein
VSAQLAVLVLAARGCSAALGLLAVAPELLLVAVELATPLAAAAVFALAAVDNIVLAAWAEPEAELPTVIDKDKKEIADS